MDCESPRPSPSIERSAKLTESVCVLSKSWVGLPVLLLQLQIRRQHYFSYGDDMLQIAMEPCIVLKNIALPTKCLWKLQELLGQGREHGG